MRSWKISSLVFLTQGILIMGCLDPYEPPVSKKSVDFLVIDGTINTTDNVATVKLSRAISLSDSMQYPKEVVATVSIENTDGHSTFLTEVAPGEYKVNSTFDQAQQYRLNVSNQGKTYLSDFISLQKNSPIDSLIWTADTEKLDIYVNSHDFRDGVKYYRYTYEEVYEYRSAFFSSYLFDNGVYTYRLPEQEINRCWISNPSSTILVTSTKALAENIISNFPVRRIERGDLKLWYQYSLLITQIALSEEAYTYWSKLKTLTESLGGLFDPLPYQLKGNIYSEKDPNEVVLGYFSGGEVSSKRVVARNLNLPNGYQVFNSGDCTEYYVEIADLHTLVGSDAILTLAKWEGPAIVGFFFSYPPCVDCRLGGGTNVKPDFMF